MRKNNLIEEYYNLIKKKITDGEYINAANYCDRFIKEFPKNELPYYLKGIINYLLNRLEESESCYLRAIEINPAHAKSYYNLGINYYFLNQKDNALINIGKAYIIFNRANDIESRNKCVESLEFIRDEDRDKK